MLQTITTFILDSDRVWNKAASFFQHSWQWKIKSLPKVPIWNYVVWMDKLAPSIRFCCKLGKLDHTLDYIMFKHQGHIILIVYTWKMELLCGKFSDLM